jgi:hypothetical protein
LNCIVEAVAKNCSPAAARCVPGESFKGRSLLPSRRRRGQGGQLPAGVLVVDPMAPGENRGKSRVGLSGSGKGRNADSRDLAC